MSQWQAIYRHLKGNNIDVYSPGQHEGHCTKPYTVVKDAGTTPYVSFSSTKTLYDLMCYVPRKEFSTLEPYVEIVKEAMKGLYPMIIPVNFETSSYLDTSVDAYMISIQYQNNRKV